MTNLYTLLFLIITTTAHDLLFFDEFQYTFNLLDSNDWDEYSITHDYKTNLNELQSDTPFFQRRLITEYITSQSNILSSTNTDHASKCTNVIPVLFKQLCVHWDSSNGFRYNYHAPTDIKSHLGDTNWFYLNKNDKISSAKNSDKYYSNLLDNNDIYLGDGATWNEINYANSISSFSLSNEASHNHFLSNYAKGSFKQCRHRPMMRECTEFHLPSKTLTVKIKTVKYRQQPKEEKDFKPIAAARNMPANLLDDAYMGYDSDVFGAESMDENYMDYDSEYDDTYGDDEGVDYNEYYNDYIDYDSVSVAYDMDYNDEYYGENEEEYDMNYDGEYYDDEDGYYESDEYDDDNWRRRLIDEYYESDESDENENEYYENEEYEDENEYESDEYDDENEYESDEYDDYYDDYYDDIMVVGHSTEE